jgi:hypothetical protein
MSLQRFFSSLAALGLAVGVIAPWPSQAQTDPPPMTEPLGWVDLIAPDLLARRLVQAAILAVRTQVEFRYDDLSVDLASGQMALTGVEVRPFRGWGSSLNCLVRADRVAIALGTPFAADHRIAGQIEIVGASAHSDCLPPDARTALTMLGQDSFALDHLRIAGNYALSTSAANVALHATLNGVAAVDLTAAFDYLGLEVSEVGRSDPSWTVYRSMYLSGAQLTIEDLGVLAVLRSVLPPELANPEAYAAMIAADIRQWLEDHNQSAERWARRRRGENPSTPIVAPLNEPQRRFVESVRVEIIRVMSGGREVSLSVGQADGRPVFLDPDWLIDNRQAFIALTPEVRSQPAQRAFIVPADLLRAATATPALLDDAARRTVGLALLTGNGAPRNIQAGTALLLPLAEAGDTAVGLALARAQAELAPDQAYRMALAAAAAREIGSLAVLDHLETGLSMQAILRAQASAAGAAPGDVPDTVAGIRRLALAHLTGTGVSRSYSLAWFFASLGTAAGDPGATAIRDEIEGRVAARGPDAREAWSRATAALAPALMSAWLEWTLPRILSER